MKSVRSGSTSENCRSSGSPPTLWWDLIVAAPSPPPGLDDVGIEGPLHEELDGRAALVDLGDDLALGTLEAPDELASHDLALLLRVA